MATLTRNGWQLSPEYAANLNLLNDTPDELFAQVENAVAAEIDIIGPECAIPLTGPVTNLLAISRQV